VPPLSFERRPWYERSAVQWGILGGSLAVFVSALLFWPVIAFAVRGLQGEHIRRTWFSGVLTCLGWLLSLLAVGFAVALVVVLQDSNEVEFGLTPPVRGLLAVTQVCAALAALTVLACLIAWGKHYWRLSGRLHFTLVALAGVGFTWFLYHWNLLTFGWPNIAS
jgi:hypothetical protein